MMAQRRVLLLSAHPLLSEGLRNLLATTEGVELIGPYDPAEFSLSRLDDCAPDVALFAEQESDQAAMTAFMLQILRACPDLPVIQVGLSGKDMLRVYTSHALPARRADLIETIRHLPARGKAE
jgi:DNA-binding NarL/FixJ family response regulator